MPEERTHPAPAFASRYGLVRPLQGRYLAGVCGALGRATGTDPVLWRVVLAVLVCFLGTGALLYLVVWLLTPEEGDTASPLEAILGRGHSSTSPMLAVVLAVAAALLLVLILPRPLYLVLAGLTGLAGLALISRARAGSRAAAAPVWAAPPRPAPATAPDPPSAASAGPVPPPPTPSAASAGPVPLPAGTVPDPGPFPAPGSAERPFAPHGPFAGPPPPPPPPLRRPVERSALPAAILSAILVVVGTVGMLDLAGVLSVPAAGYLAAALGVVGAGLLAGAWLGRARPLIALGIVLALALPVVHAMDVVDPPEHMGDLTWAPRDRAELADEYALALGSGLVDLRQVDFAGQTTMITVRISFGEMRVALPPEVAVEATVHVRFGDATVLDAGRDELPGGTITDLGSGDPADGRLILDLYVQFGSLAVHR
jgi:phage shock protein PspC (stress-responsive transcriptional regulator)